MRTSEERELRRTLAQALCALRKIRKLDLAYPPASEPDSVFGTLGYYARQFGRALGEASASKYFARGYKRRARAGLSP